MIKVRSNFDKHVVLMGLSLILGIYILGPLLSPCHGQDLSVSSEATQLFEEEVQRAEKASERDVKIEHYRNALKHRPGHPDNLAAEFRIAVLLSQHYDPKNPKPVRRRDSVAVYESILRTYKHMDYYSKRPVDSSSDMQFIIPVAAIHLACLYRGLDGDNSKARQWTRFSMKSMAETYERRKTDWLSESQPLWPGKQALSMLGIEFHEKMQGRIELWKQRQEDAAEGDVFSPLEMEVVKAAVRQYGYSFGLRQKAGDVALAMGNILRDFPGTPMAKIAEGHLERAKEMQLEELNRSIMDELSENISRDSEPLDELTKSESDSFEGKEIFIPEAGIALTKKAPFVLDLFSSKLLDPDAKVDSKQAYENLLKLGKGDIAWDGSLITVRKAKALTIQDESHRPLKSTPGRWCNWDEFPDKVDLPYSVLVVTNEEIDYLITIRKIETDGIRIAYKKLSPNEAKNYLPTKKKKE